MWTAKIKDEYDREARLKPVLIACIPVFLLLVAAGLNVSILWTVLIAPLAAFGCVEFVTQIGGDMGKQKEPALFSLWGGKPTSAMLRYRSLGVNPHVRERYIAAGREILPQLQFPTREEEAQNPSDADHVYDAFARYLIERTRDKSKYPLVFKELVNYGFRRNLWGMKPLALSTITVAISILSGCVGYDLLHRQNPGGVLISALILEVLFLAVWSAWINPGWVKLSADRYAGRLFECSEILRPECKISP